MENHLKRVLNLVRKTGDTMVVVDKEGSDSFVVMDLDQYEILVDGNMDFDLDEDYDSPDEDLVDEPFSPTSDSRPPTSDIWDVMPEAGEFVETWDVDALSDEEMADLERQYQEFSKRNTEPKKAADASEVQETPASSKEDEYGEEQFYLEPVE